MERSAERKPQPQWQGDNFLISVESENWRQGYYSRKRKTNEATEKDTYIQVSVHSPPRKIAKSKRIHQSIHTGEDIIII